MPNINLRGVEEKTLMHLKEEAQANNISVNSLILQFIHHSLGIVHTRHKPVYHDLDALAGTWTEADEQEFNAATASFNDIDKEMW